MQVYFLKFAVPIFLMLIVVHAGTAGETPPPADGVALEDDDLIEAFPRQAAVQIARRVDDLSSAGLDGAYATRGLYASLNLWPPTMKRLNVCFFGGERADRQRVVKIASEWMLSGAFVPFHFGDDPANPATCTGAGNDEHIRVGFVKDGTIWSAVGNQSVNKRLYPPGQPSMNLGFKATVGPERVRRAILHEFGHALGLEHEHQNKLGNCKQEYDFPALVSYFKNTLGWSENDVKTNLYVIEKSGVIATEFDRQSIMLYSHPVRFYKKGKDSPCFIKERAQLSPGDRSLISQLYPADAAAREKQAHERAGWWSAKIAEVADRLSRDTGLDLKALVDHSLGVDAPR